MNGTEKQIKWAEDIRANMIADMDAFLSRTIAENKTAPEEQIEKIKKQREAAYSAAMNQNDAKWWIDNGRDQWQVVAKMLLGK